MPGLLNLLLFTRTPAALCCPNSSSAEVSEPSQSHLYSKGQHWDGQGYLNFRMETKLSGVAENQWVLIIKNKREGGPLCKSGEHQVVPRLVRDPFESLKTQAYSREPLGKVAPSTAIQHQWKGS